MPIEATEEQIDRASEWIGEHYPNAEHEVYEARFAEALAEIMALDAAADRQEAM